MLSINIITMGCSKNRVDSENIGGHALKSGHKVYYERPHNDCDIVIVNTCGFIGDAKEESINEILTQIENKTRFNRRHTHDGKCRRLIVIGCLVERYRRVLKKEFPEVDEWYGVHQWDRITRSLGRKEKTPFCQLRKTSTPKHYAYLKISEGCDRSCSYCAIPKIRGAHRSRPIEEIVEEAKMLVQQGVQELLVIAQDTTYYGIDLYGKRKIAELMERLATETKAKWIRLHYTYPTGFPQELIAVMAKYANICKYIDIPLQHINSGLLQSMHRGIDREGTLKLIEDLRSQIPGITIRTTLIVGYPGEGIEEFEELKSFVQQARFNLMGCFAYSPEEGTPAYQLGDPVDEEEKLRRVDELMMIQENLSLEINSEHIGKIYRVLIDQKEGDGIYIGRTEYDSPEVDNEVIVTSEERLSIGKFYDVKINDAYEHDLQGELYR